MGSMPLKKQLLALSGGGALLAVLSVGTGGLFKIAAFAREAFIASRFGLSGVTDAYFAFQQFPLMLVAFMFGAFGLAFTPLYAAEKRDTGQVAWLPGLVVYGGALGTLLTLLTIVLAPWLVRAFSDTPTSQAASTLVILSCSFAPIVCLGIWAGTTLANGRNLLAMFVTGLPYLVMTALLLGLYALGKLDNLSLPVSFLAGFAAVGAWALWRLLKSDSRRLDLRAATEAWKMPGFRRFIRQLTASSIENIGFSANQLLLIYFVVQTGTGAVSANTCAMRVGMLGFSLLGQPLAQLVQARLCAVYRNQQAAIFRRWLLAISLALFAFAGCLYLLRAPVTSMVYLHGKFTGVELDRVIEIMPAWLAYFVVASLNAIVARYLFTSGAGKSYVRRQLLAYAAANLVRVACWGNLSAQAVVWCSVAAEGCALLLSLRSCFRRSETPVLEPVMLEAQQA